MQESSINEIKDSSSALIRHGDKLKNKQAVFVDAASEIRKKDPSKSPLGVDNVRAKLKSFTQTRNQKNNCTMQEFDDQEDFEDTGAQEQKVVF